MQKCNIVVQKHMKLEDNTPFTALQYIISSVTMIRALIFYNQHQQKPRFGCSG